MDICSFCRSPEVEFACDFPITDQKPCGRHICATCTATVGRDRFYCPDHTTKCPGCHDTPDVRDQDLRTLVKKHGCDRCRLALLPGSKGRLQMAMKTSKGADVPLDVQCQGVGLPQVEKEWFFHKKRRWRFDFAFVELRLAVEIEGGIWARKGAKKCAACGETPKGGHSTGRGMLEDLEKYNSATLGGWRLIRITPSQVRDGTALAIIERAVIAIQRGFEPAAVQMDLHVSAVKQFFKKETNAKNSKDTSEGTSA